MPKSSILDFEKTNKNDLTISGNIPYVESNFQKSKFAQIGEMIELAFGIGKITPREYYYFGLYNDRMFSRAEKKSFLGHATQVPIGRAVIDGDWMAVADDKLVFESYFRANGFPVANSIALYHKLRKMGRLPSFGTQAELRQFLSGKAPYPLFGKPIASRDSFGAAHILGVDPSGKTLRLIYEKSAPLDRFIEEIDSFSDGYLFQEPLVSHQALREKVGERLATARIVLMLAGDGPKILRTTWRVPIGENISDNTWRGNLLAGVDPQSGRVIKVIDCADLRRSGVTHHPDTDQEIAGFVLPLWKESLDLCLSAAMMLPGIRLQAWDVAICQDGPKLVEVQPGGDFNQPQLASGCGMLDADFKQFLAQWNPSWRRDVHIYAIRRCIDRVLSSFRPPQRTKDIH